MGAIAKTVLTLFSTRVKMSACANPFIEKATVLDATHQINSCMITTNKNTHICSLHLYSRETNEVYFKSFRPPPPVPVGVAMVFCEKKDCSANFGK